MPDNILERITYEVVDHVARIELVRSQAHNGLDPNMGVALRTAAEYAAKDVASGEARVVVVGAQGRVFSVGGDLGHFAQAGDRGAEVKATAEGLHAGLATLRSLDVPVVSVINGTAAGGGLGIALVGDIVIAAAEAKLVMAYTTSGLTPDCGLTSIVTDRLTWARAMDLALMNRVLTGTEAAEWGLVSRVVPASELGTTVEAVVSTLRDGPAGAFAQTKRLMAAAGTTAFEDQLDQEAASIAQAMNSPEGTEGVDAFLAKRKPSYA